MILWTIKQLLSLRKAILGRANPSELAWGLAIGLAIGLVPKGNLISLLLIGTAVSLRINHGMVALSAVAFSFMAAQFDPITHQMGAGILQDPQVRMQLDRWWGAPLVPWTDLNNTVVMGSTVLAMIGMIPAFVVSLPVFRWLSRRPEAQPSGDPPPAESVAIAMPADDLPRTAEPPEPAVLKMPNRSQQPAASTADAGTQETKTKVATQIDVIRLSHPLTDGDDGDDTAENAHRQGGTMNETLGYLLRRLRDSRQEKAA